jgi:hypothetical protein
MPFDQFIPRPLTPVAVHTYAPTESGVYGISNAREWIYIGETDDIQNALLGHLQAARYFAHETAADGVCLRGLRRSAPAGPTGSPDSRIRADL